MYYTENVGVAALIICQGWKVLDVKRNPNNPQRFVCVFPDEVKEIALSYFQGATVEAKAHQEASLSVLAMIREARNE